MLLGRTNKHCRKTSVYNKLRLKSKQKLSTFVALLSHTYSVQTNTNTPKK